MCEQERAERIGDKVISLESLELRDTVCTCVEEDCAHAWRKTICACVERDVCACVELSSCNTV